MTPNHLQTEFFCKITIKWSSWRAFKNMFSAASMASFEKWAYVQHLNSKDLQLYLYLTEFNRICTVQHTTRFYCSVLTKKLSSKTIAFIFLGKFKIYEHINIFENKTRMFSVRLFKLPLKCELTRWWSKEMKQWIFWVILFLLIKE